jgi:hypothetical protein
VKASQWQQHELSGLSVSRRLVAGSGIKIHINIMPLSLGRPIQMKSFYASSLLQKKSLRLEVSRELIQRHQHKNGSRFYSNLISRSGWHSAPCMPAKVFTTNLNLRSAARSFFGVSRLFVPADHRASFASLARSALVFSRNAPPPRSGSWNLTVRTSPCLPGSVDSKIQALALTHPGNTRGFATQKVSSSGHPILSMYSIVILFYSTIIWINELILFAIHLNPLNEFQSF